MLVLTLSLLAKIKAQKRIIVIKKNSSFSVVVLASDTIQNEEALSGAKAERNKGISIKTRAKAPEAHTIISPG